jgi:hypothetical protein
MIVSPLRFTLAALVVVTASASALAQQPRPAPAPQRQAAPPAAPQQPQPSAAAIALAKEVLAVKGSMRLLDPVVNGVIEQTRSIFMRTNFMLQKDLNDVAGELRTEFAPRRDVLVDDVARLYARRFTEQEMKDTLAFYNSPLGQKLIIEEPQFVDQSLQYAQIWANKLSEEVISKFRAGMKKRGHDL